VKYVVVSGNGKTIYHDSSIDIFFFLNEEGEEVECNEQGVEVTA